MVLLFLLLFVLVLNSTYFMTAETKVKGSNRTMACSIAEQVIMAKRVIDPMLKSYIPHLIILILNLKVVMYLRRSKKWVRSCYKFTLTTIVIDFIYLIFNLPDTIFKVFEILDSIYFYQYQKKLGSYKRSFIFLFFSLLTPSLSVGYSVGLFFIFAIFNQIFRKEIITFFRLNHFMSKYFFGG